MRILTINSLVNTDELAKQIRVPTLVLHNTGDRIVPVAEGRRLARLIPGALFCELPGNDHVAIKGHPCFDKFFDAIRPFLRQHEG